MAGLGIMCLVFDNSSLDEQLLLKQQPSALCHWLIDNNRDYVGRREDVMYNCWVRGRAREEEGLPLDGTRGCVVGLSCSDHSPVPWFPLCSQQVKLHAACPLSVSPARKSLSYSLQVQKFHLTLLNTSAFKPQSSCSCFSSGFLCPLAWKCHSAKPMWDVHPFFN